MGENYDRGQPCLDSSAGGLFDVPEADYQGDRTDGVEGVGVWG